MGFLPILFGGFIYLLTRPKTIYLFDWIKSIDMEKEADTIREYFSEYQMSEWVIYNLPDLLWVFSFTSVMLIIWKGVHSKFEIAYITLPLFVGVTSEILQYYNPTFGTFDFKDIAFYFIGFLSSILILKTIDQRKNEKQTTTLI